MVTMLFFCLTLFKFQDPEAEPPKSSASFGIYNAWWTREESCKELGITDAQRKELSKELNNLQTSYQLAQTKLNDARKVQTAMMFDASVSHEALLTFNKEQVSAQSDAMQDLNFKARVLVRKALDKNQLAHIAKKFPQFFTARWFKTSRVQVREGKVVIKKP